MPKTKDELNRIKEEVAELNGKLKELSDDELKEVLGGTSAHDHNDMLSGIFNYFSSNFQGQLPNRNDDNEPEDKPNITIDNGIGYTK